MSERDDFELRVADMVRGLADRADTSVDPTATAWRAADAARRAWWPPDWLALRRLAWVALLVVLLLLLMATALSPGGGIRELLAPMEPLSQSTVHATLTCGDPSGGESTTLDAATLLTLDSIRCEIDADDVPHAGGSIAFTTRVGDEPVASPTAAADPRLADGAFTLMGSHGRWVGRWFAVPDATGHAQLVSFAQGDGAYAGWSYAMAVKTQTDTTALIGEIYPGDPPPGLPLDWSASPAAPAATFGPSD